VMKSLSRNAMADPGAHPGAQATPQMGVCHRRTERRDQASQSQEIAVIP